MPDLKDLLDDLAGPADRPGSDVVRADLARGRRTLRRTRGIRLAAAAVAAAAATGVGAGLSGSGALYRGEVSATAAPANAYADAPDMSGPWEIVLTHDPQGNREWNHLRFTRQPDSTCTGTRPCYSAQQAGMGWQDVSTQITATVRGKWIEVRLTGGTVNFWATWTLEGRAPNDVSTPLTFRGTWTASPPYDELSGTFTMRREPGCTDDGCPPAPPGSHLTPSPMGTVGTTITTTPGVGPTTAVPPSSSLVPQLSPSSLPSSTPTFVPTTGTPSG